jgi:hypothetical protein
MNLSNQESICTKQDIAIIIVLLLLLFGFLFGIINTSKENPCYSYTSDTLASDVSVKCIQYIWYNSGCSYKYIIPDNYAGFYTNSPQGTKMIKCDAFHHNSMCGVGSYGNMVEQLKMCNVADINGLSQT